MATISVADVAFQTHPHHLFVSSSIGGSKLYVNPKKYSLNCRKHSHSKRFITLYYHYLSHSPLKCPQICSNPTYILCRKFLHKSDSVFKSRNFMCCSVVCYNHIIISILLYLFFSYNIKVSNIILLDTVLIHMS